MEGESSSLFYVARSLLKLQSLFGTIPNIKAKGALSQVCFRQWWNCAPCQATYVARNSPQLVLDMMLRMKDEDTEKSTQSPEIDTLILLDRRVDMVSPMVTPLTFEALMDETMNIENGTLHDLVAFASCLFDLFQRDCVAWPRSIRASGPSRHHGKDSRRKQGRGRRCSQATREGVCVVAVPCMWPHGLLTVAPLGCAEGGPAAEFQRPLVCRDPPHECNRGGTIVAREGPGVAADLRGACCAQQQKRRNASVVLIAIPADARTDTTCKPSRKSRSL